MSTATTRIRRRHASRVSRMPRAGVGRPADADALDRPAMTLEELMTARYLLDEPAMTADDVMAARGWDRRHRRYRRAHRP